VDVGVAAAAAGEAMAAAAAAGVDGANIRANNSLERRVDRAPLLRARGGE
jgi:hypothetical protein